MKVFPFFKAINVTVMTSAVWLLLYTKMIFINGSIQHGFLVGVVLIIPSFILSSIGSAMLFSVKTKATK